MTDEAGNQVSIEEVAARAVAPRKESKPIVDVAGQTVIAGMEGERKVEKRPRKKRGPSKFVLVNVRCDKDGVPVDPSIYDAVTFSSSLAALDKAMKDPKLPEGLYLKMTIRESFEIKTETARRISVIKG